MTKLANYLENKIWYMLLFTVAVIPLEQEFTSFCVAMTFIGAVIVSHVKGRPQQENVLKPWQQGAFYLLLLIAVVSVYFSLDRFLSFWNLVYVVGQYAALFFVLLRYGRSSEQDRATLTACEAEQLTQSEAWKNADTKQKIALVWQRFGILPRPLQLIGAFLGVSLLVSAIGIVQKIFGVTAEGIWVDPAQFPDLKVRVFSTLVNPNILAGYLVLVVAYSTAFFNQTKAYKNGAWHFWLRGFWQQSACFIHIHAVTG